VPDAKRKNGTRDRIKIATQRSVKEYCCVRHAIVGEHTRANLFLYAQVSLSKLLCTTHRFRNSIASLPIKDPLSPPGHKAGIFGHCELVNAPDVRQEFLLKYQSSILPWERARIRLNSMDHYFRFVREDCYRVKHDPDHLHRRTSATSSEYPLWR
jgi:hypothetical protein